MPPTSITTRTLLDMVLEYMTRRVHDGPIRLGDALSDQTSVTLRTALLELDRRKFSSRSTVTALLIDEANQ